MSHLNESDPRPEGTPRLPTEDEILIPPGEPMETELHLRQGRLLAQTLEAYWRDRDDFYVGADMFLYFSLEQTKTHDFRAPDVFVAMGVPRRVRKAWVVWAEGNHVPDVIIELLSDTTAHIDRGVKRYVYERLNVPEYYVFDPETGEFAGWRNHGEGGYVRVLPDGRGRIASRATGLELGRWDGENEGIRTTWLRWYAPDGAVLPTERELARLAETAATAAQAEAERAQADAERSQADAERAQAAFERAQAAAERERGRAEGLATQLAEYARRFGALDEP